MNEIEQAQLWQLLQQPPADGDLWDGPKVALWMSELLGRAVHPQRGWEYLRAMEMRRRRPRPMHQDTDPIEQSAGKKNYSSKVNWKVLSASKWRILRLLNTNGAK